MRKGKEKCEILKAIRTYVADKYGVEYTPSECNHKGECQGTCPKCDGELADLQEKLEAKGITDISEDAILREMVRNYLSKTKVEDYSLLVPDDDSERTQGMPMPLQGDLAIEDGLVPDDPIEGNMDFFPIEKRKLFLECNIAGAAFYNIDDIWDELQDGSKLVLVREKYNVHDENAVAVAIAGDEGSEYEDVGPTLGYIPRKVNKSLAALLDMGWQDVFETEISGLRKDAPYSDRIHISIFIKKQRCRRRA